LLKNENHGSNQEVKKGSSDYCPFWRIKI